MDYKKAGVDRKKVKELLDNSIKPRVNTALFAGLFPLDLSLYKEPVLVSSTDGVGTKLMLAAKFNKYEGIAQDLFAMVINDITATGGVPLFFLDCVSSNRIDPRIAKIILNGLSALCEKHKITLLGGETAEMPKFYARDSYYDLTGFGVGIAEKKGIINGERITAGDILIGFTSSGIHSNGFSLIRRALTDAQLTELKDELMKPTRIYNELVKALGKKIKIKGLFHITGGGLPDNILRLMPEGLDIDLHLEKSQVPRIFKKIMEYGDISLYDMFSVFNMGYGLAAAVSASDVSTAEKLAVKCNIEAERIGVVEKGEGTMRIFTKKEVLEFRQGQ